MLRPFHHFHLTNMQFIYWVTKQNLKQVYQAVNLRVRYYAE